MRDTTKLHPDLQEKIAELQTLCKKNGLIIGISECLRTVAEQDALYAQGRTAPGNIVTNAKGSTYSSMHQWGVAFDFYRNDGKGAYVDSDGFFTKVGKLGQSIGLEWGGSWKTPDRPHFQLSNWGSTPTKLKAEFSTPEKFIKTWVVKPVQNGTYQAIKDAYLRSTPAVGDNKVIYAKLSATMKKKCNNIKGVAQFKAGTNFTLVDSKKVKGNIWGKTKSGYWLPVKKDGKDRAKKIK